MTSLKRGNKTFFPWEIFVRWNEFHNTISRTILSLFDAARLRNHRKKKIPSLFYKYTKQSNTATNASRRNFIRIILCISLQLSKRDFDGISMDTATDGIQKKRGRSTQCKGPHAVFLLAWISVLRLLVTPLITHGFPRGRFPSTNNRGRKSNTFDNATGCIEF